MSIQNIATSANLTLKCSRDVLVFKRINDIILIIISIIEVRRLYMGTENDYIYIGEKIVENQLHLARMFRNVVAEHSPQNFETAGMSETDILDLNTELIKCFGEVLYKDEKTVIDQVENWAKKGAKLTIDYNISLTQSMRIISCYQPIIWDFFDEELRENRITPITVIAISKKINRVIDLVMRIFGEAHEQHNLMLTNTAYTALEELSVPVVPIAKGLAVIPLVGAIDTERASWIQEIALSESIRMGLENMVIDISGVPVIDTMVTNELFSIISSLKLVGVETSITGIRPSIAQTITNLGINFKNINTRANLQQALAELGFKKVDVNK